ncbi:translation initiation factor eIF-2B subunit delta-like, partial [Pollicipes pollicipes]|uniref:translation initiation factor eIF-2B subunit delta-like n=1 Tax=Pollicipes pollicipes TaxID=41117 RepID=UPI0018858E17
PPDAAKSPPAAAKSPPDAAKSPPAAAKSQPAAAKSPPDAAKSQPAVTKSPPAAAKSPPVAAQAPAQKAAPHGEAAAGQRKSRGQIKAERRARAQAAKGNANNPAKVAEGNISSAVKPAEGNANNPAKAAKGNANNPAKAAEGNTSNPAKAAKGIANTPNTPVRAVNANASHPAKPAKASANQPAKVSKSNTGTPVKDAKASVSKKASPTAGGDGSAQAGGGRGAAGQASPVARPAQAPAPAPALAAGAPVQTAAEPSHQAQPADGQQKSREQVKAERKAKAEAAKLAKAAKANANKSANANANELGKSSTSKAAGAGASKSEASLPAAACGAGAAGQATASRPATAPSARPPLQSPPGPKTEDTAQPDKKNSKKAPAATKHHIHMFSHLPQFDAGAVDALTLKHGVHPAVLRLGLRLAAGRITGANAGAVALLAALAALVEDYKTPAQRELRRDLPDQVRRAVGHVAACQPLSVAMENAAARLDHAIRTEVADGTSDNEAKKHLSEWIEFFIRDNICKAVTAITHYALERIKDGDTILTYGKSAAVLDVLREAHMKGLRFHVVVVDSRPHLEGRGMLRMLLDAGVTCSYGMISAISHHMKQATKVLLGAHALLSNGMVLSRAGSAMVSLAGRALNRPVLVCCEKYKFSERVQTDSQVYNRLGDPDALVPAADSPLADWRRCEALTLLNLAYDVTPPELVDVVITELGAIPCTSAPAVLRLQQHAGY